MRTRRRPPAGLGALVAAACLVAQLLAPGRRTVPDGPAESRAPATLTWGERPPTMPRPEAGAQPHPERVPTLDSPTTPADPGEDTTPASAPSRAPGWNILMTETFEGSFPTGLWEVFDNDGAADGEYF